MIKVSNERAYNFMGAVRGMRNSWGSWDKMDSFESTNVSIKSEQFESWGHDGNIEMFVLGENDKILALKLLKAGSDHAKFTRQILVSFDLTAPLYFWKQFDQYRVGVTSNSTSTMHTIQREAFTPELFSIDIVTTAFEAHLTNLELLRQMFLETKDKSYWRAIIQMLPDSFNQTRHITCNYQVLRNMYHSRKNHKLKEWHDFCSWIETLPYSELITTKNPKK